MRLGHVHLKVRNLNRAERFYCTLLGAKRTERVGEDFSFLTMSDSHHDVALQELGDSAPGPAPYSVGLYHTAFEVVDSKELLDSIERLESISVEYALVDHGISWAVYTSDPDGNGVEIYLDRRHSYGGAVNWKGKSHRLDKQELVRLRKAELAQ